MSYHPDREFERRQEALEERAIEEEQMDTVMRHTPAPKTFGPGRVLYELAGPADPTWDELSDRMRRAWQAAGRYLAWEESQEHLPGALRTVQRPTSAVESFECHVEAVVAVLERELPAWREAAGSAHAREFAEKLLTAAEVGF